MIGRRKINEWIELIQRGDHNLISRLESIYGSDKPLIDERLENLLKLAGKFKQIYGENKEANFVRAPGRLNTLGMHIDHRGGFVNPIAINREVTICYASRNDDLIKVHNMDPVYGERNFHISAELPQGTISTVKDWLSWTQKETDKRKQAGVNHDWVNKLKAIPVYLRVVYPDRRLSGFEAVLNSNIPPRVGLSSSSVIVVAVLEIMIDVNNLPVTDDEFVNYCGTGEWYVGTRGGSGDHAAIKFSRSEMITHMRTVPRLEISSYLPFPKSHQLIIFDSGIEADKTGPARQKFNEKTATYETGEIYVREYLKKNHRNIFDKMEKFYLADVVECLNRSQIYEMLQSLPERMDRKGLLQQFPEHEHLLKEQFATHLEPEDGYRIRSVLMYGIAEAERSRMLEEVINESKIELFGQLMNVSHDGDRVLFQSPEMEEGKRSIDVNKQLYLQPGGYDCSIPEIDEMVDLALEAGAEGAQISGAGLGGSMMALVKTEDVNRVVGNMISGYYKTRGMKENFIVAAAVEGTCLL